MSKLRYSILYEIDKDFLIDKKTLRDEYENNWQVWLDEFAEYELGEVITGMGSDPIEIKVIEDKQ